MGIPISRHYLSTASKASGASGAKSTKCEKCSTDYIFRTDESSTEPPSQHSKFSTSVVACPNCGWFQKDMIGLCRKQKQKRFFLLLTTALVLVFGLDFLWAGRTMLQHRLLLFTFVAAGGVAAAFLYNPNRGYRKTTGSPTRASQSRGVAFIEGDQDELSDQDLEWELHRCLRAAMITMAEIDGELHPSEFIAIASIYQKITGERVDVATIESEVQEALGHSEEMLKRLSCLAPYLRHEGKAMFLRAVYQIAASDGHVDPLEKKLMKSIAKVLEMDAHDFVSVVGRPPLPKI